VQLDRALTTLADWGEPAYRRTQVRQAVTRDLIASWDEATTLSKALRARLAEAVPVRGPPLEDEQRSEDGTVKARWSTADGFPVETVLMRHKDRRTGVCLLPVRLRAGLHVLRHGLDGTRAQPEPGGDLRAAPVGAREARTEDARIGNVVLMGMGEPFMNYDEVLGFCRLANDPDGFGLGARSIAISTAGWVPGIDRLSEEPLQVKLALSLHAPTDKLRTTLMPVTKRYPLHELMEACRRYRERTRRRIFIEYLLLDGVNDSVTHAEQLCDLLWETAPGGFHVNLIVYNPTGSTYRASGDAGRSPRSRQSSTGAGSTTRCGAPRGRTSTRLLGSWPSRAWRSVVTPCGGNARPSVSA
jgi:23S rRNA (adenine2503-C2)-methyltransferase